MSEANNAYTYHDTLDFLYDRDAKENPHPQDPAIFSAPVDEHFYTKFGKAIRAFQAEELTDTAFVEAIRQFSNHCCTPVSARLFWLDFGLTDLIFAFFLECSEGKHREPAMHWRRQLIGALVGLVDTRGAAPILELLPVERFDLILAFILRNKNDFPSLWRILHEISFTDKLLKGYELSVIAAGVEFLRVLHEQLGAAVTRERLEHVSYVCETCYNVSLASAEAFSTLLSTDDVTGFLAQFEKVFNLCAPALDATDFIEKCKVFSEAATIACCKFIVNIVTFDRGAALSFCKGAIPRSLCILLGDISKDVRISSFNALSCLAATNTAVENLWVALEGADTMKFFVEGVESCLTNADQAVRQCAIEGVTRIFDGPLRTKRHILSEAIAAAESCNEDLREPFNSMKALVLSK